MNGHPRTDRQTAEQTPSEVTPRSCRTCCLAVSTRGRCWSTQRGIVLCSRPAFKKIARLKLEYANIRRTRSMEFHALSRRTGSSRKQESVYFVHPPHTLSIANKLAQRASGAMDMQELLGLGSGDFEGVEFAASSESEDEEEPNAGGSAKVVPRSNTSTSGKGAENSNVENTPAAAAAAGPSPTAMGTTTILQVWSIWGCWRAGVASAWSS